MISDAAIRELCGQLWPGATVERIEALGADPSAAGETTAKGFGYGVPIRIDVRQPDGAAQAVVLHTAGADDFGHDRRCDRAAAQLGAFDDFPRIPGHVPAIDVGALTAAGRLRSLRDCGELYLVTSYAPGRIYADDLRRIAAAGRLEDRDRRRGERLADYLVALHAERLAEPARYTRAVRDLVGDGEGIFGLIDGFPPAVDGAAPARLRDLERRCVDWRWRLRGREARLARTHGDFHPFNLLFDDADELALLDCSRGACGDPADDVTCLAINYVFFALDHPAAWRGALGALWHGLWDRYLAASGDAALLEVAPPWFAWRALVLANPRWYPSLPARSRDALLGLAEQALEAGRLDPEAADALFP